MSLLCLPYCIAKFIFMGVRSTLISENIKPQNFTHLNSLTTIYKAINHSKMVAKKCYSHNATVFFDFNDDFCCQKAHHILLHCAIQATSSILIRTKSSILKTMHARNKSNNLSKIKWQLPTILSVSIV